MNTTKAILAWLFFLLISKMCPAQQYDKVWAVGSPVSTMAFDGDSVILEELQDSLTPAFVTIGNICDNNGNFLFYSNGLSVYNRYGNIMPNGDSLSYPSEYYSQQEPLGVASSQGLVILPKPNDINNYYIFHFTSTDTITTLGGYEADMLYYSIVDMTQDSGKGDLIAKNIPIIQNKILSASRIAACKHANGRDWWIIKPVWHYNIYYTFLLTPDSLEGPFIQQFGPLYGLGGELAAYSCFSPDGSKYASVTPDSYVVLMDFDRCTGLFSKADSFYNYYPFNSSSGGVGLSFSPNGRFLYVNSIAELNQYDLWSAQIHDSIRIETDTNEFYQMGNLQLAPNGKIYVSCYNGGSYKIHVINQPDSLGLSCDFQLFQQSVLTPNSWDLPYFPNYRLGALIGSECDTITGITDVETPQKSEAIIEPNPASNTTSLIYYSNGSKVNAVNIYNNLGELVLTKTDQTNSGKIDLDISRLVPGIYMVRFTADGNALLNTKLVIER